MKTTNALLTLAVCVIVLSGSLACSGEGAPSRPPAFVTVGTVVETDNIEVKRYTGHVTSSSSVNLVARVSGELLHVGFSEGDMIDKDQVLYELNDVRYVADVANLEARIAECEARLAYAELSHNRARELHRQNAGTKDSVDSAESEYKAAKAALLAAEAQLVTAKDDLKNTRIVAPISGKIGVTAYTEGNYLTPNSGVIATIIQLDPLRITFSMANRDYLSMFGSEEKLKERARLRLKLADDSIYEMEGAVEFIDNQANQRTDAVRVYARFDNPEGKLMPGSAVTVLLSRSNGGREPAVLPSAVMHDSKSAYVYVVDENYKVERRDVVLGYGTGSIQNVKSGLKPGEIVVIDGMHKTMPGATIEPDFRGTSTTSLSLLPTTERAY